MSEPGSVPTPKPAVQDAHTVPPHHQPYNMLKVFRRPPDCLPAPAPRIPQAAPILPTPTTIQHLAALNGKKARKPRAGCEIDNNELRPHVAALDRLRTWTSPYGQEHDAKFRASLPADVVNRTYTTIFASFAPETQSNYAAGLLRFHQFCDKHQIPERARMPASHFLLAAFIAEHVGTVGGGTVKSWMSGIKAWHDVNGAPWEGEDRWVELARRTANKQGTAFKRAQRGPVIIAHLIALRTVLDTSKPFDAAAWSMATAAFWGCRRLGELSIPSLGKFDPKFHATRGAKALCPEKAFANHILVNATVPDEAPLFAFDAGSGKWSPMTKDWFMRRCSDIWKAANLLLVHGHSFRIGGSTELLLAGVPCGAVAALGGWTSLAFLLYWRKIEHIVPMNIGKAYDKNKLDEFLVICSTFPLPVPPVLNFPSLQLWWGELARAKSHPIWGELRSGLNLHLPLRADRILRSRTKTFPRGSRFPSSAVRLVASPLTALEAAKRPSGRTGVDLFPYREEEEESGADEPIKSVGSTADVARFSLQRPFTLYSMHLSSLPLARLLAHSVRRRLVVRCPRTVPASSSAREVDMSLDGAIALRRRQATVVSDSAYDSASPHAADLIIFHKRSFAVPCLLYYAVAIFATTCGTPPPRINVGGMCVSGRRSDGQGERWEGGITVCLMFPFSLLIFLSSRVIVSAHGIAIPCPLIVARRGRTLEAPYTYGVESQFTYVYMRRCAGLLSVSKMGEDRRFVSYCVRSPVVDVDVERGTARCGTGTWGMRR
ncbi:hypothetical protein C8R44DRAFT_896353 [Mycena epipterygia]|nr:hypothetical protein C8R44DRAFT_896353 [Mycena epipterygia]